MVREVKLRIVLQHPIEGVLYGLQQGNGANYECVQPQLGKGQDLTFEFSVQVKQVNSRGISLNGPNVQGPAGKVFVYIDIGSYAGQTGAQWNGRLKIPLSEVDFADAISDEGAYCWSCSVPGRNKDGKPVFATVKPFSGWSKRRQSDRTGA
jgi:hypothetical protein